MKNKKDECTCDCGCDCCKKEINATRFGSALIIAGSVITAPLLYGLIFSCGGAGGSLSKKDMKDYLMQNPKVIVDSVEAYYKAKAPAAAQKPKVADKKMIKEITKDTTNTVLGNPKGKFVIIEFFDYNCGYCKKMNKALAGAVKKSDNIRWILIDTPIFGEQSEIISRYAYAANEQGKFQQFHEEIGKASAKLDEAALLAIGEKLDLDTKALKKAAASKKIKDKLIANRKYTEKLGMGGVPMFIIDGDVQGGAFSDEKLAEYIAKANKKK